MELNINSPAYFTPIYGVDDTVYNYCQKLHYHFKDKEYSQTLHTIGIMPVAAPKELYEAGEWKEELRLLNHKSLALISIRMDFDSYYSADSQEKAALMKKTILAAVRKVKSKGKFDYLSFEWELESIDWKGK